MDVFDRIDFTTSFEDLVAAGNNKLSYEGPNR